MTEEQLHRLVDGLAAETRRYVEGIVPKLIAKHMETSATTKALTPRWGGIWTPGRAYQKDALCAYKHQLWIALEATTSEPGIPGGGGWQLCLRGPR